MEKEEIADAIHSLFNLFGLFIIIIVFMAAFPTIISVLKDFTGEILLNTGLDVDQLSTRKRLHDECIHINGTWKNDTCSVNVTENPTHVYQLSCIHSPGQETFSIRYYHDIEDLQMAPIPNNCHVFSKRLNND